jgi:hypothetical protein
MWNTVIELVKKANELYTKIARVNLVYSYCNISHKFLA